MLNDIKKIISFQTVMNEGENGTPFGQNIADALKWFADRAKELGLNSYSNGYYAYAETVGGDSDSIIGIAAHLDVVPVNPSDWHTPPFELVEKDGILYGRGIADDKGPAIICLHAVAELNKFNLKHKIRIIVGGDEENASRCLKKYCEEQKMPVCSLVPDADFPLIYSEKGILHLNFTMSLRDSYGITELCGGEKANVIPGYCKLVLDKKGEAALALGDIYASIAKRKLKKDDFLITETENSIIIEAHGVAGHAMAPEEGDNAIAKITALLTPLLEFDRLNKYAACSTAKNDLGLDLCDETGELTMNLGKIYMQNNEIHVTMDFRLPICCTPDRVQEALFKKLRPDSIVVDKYSPNLYVPADSKFVRCLLKCYSSVTGDKRGPDKTGGGTYARSLKNAIAYGPTFPGTKTNIHNANECIPVKHLEMLYEIYVKTIAMLDKEI